MFFYSYDMKDPVFKFGGWTLSFQIFSYENIYGLDPENCVVRQSNNSWSLECARFSWAGQQRQMDGQLKALAFEAADGSLMVKLDAAMPMRIRCVKILVRDLPLLDRMDTGGLMQQVTAEGLTASYPSYDCRMPLMAVYPAGSDRGFVFRCEDTQVRQKRFAVFSEENLWGSGERFTVELIHEEDARVSSCRIDVPWWTMKHDTCYDEIEKVHLDFCERNYGLIPWAERDDVPSWMKKVCLCLCIHGAHWSGHIFNTYEDMLGILRFTADRIDPGRVLVYLPGWEGRYYWNYGFYRPDPAMGGEEGFARLCHEAAAMGFHLMPMVGGNCANSWLHNFEAFGSDAYMKSASRMRYHGNSPDWSQDRSNDTGWQAWLNPGHPSWQRELTNQILELSARYNWDGVFLDTIYAWTNDPDHSVYGGVRSLVERLQSGRPGLLVASESFYDGLLSCFPLVQNDELNRPVIPVWFKKYGRTFSFLGHAEPSKGSGGVQHYRRMSYPQPEMEETYIPTAAFVKDTLVTAKAAVEDTIEAGKQYARQFLGA